MAPHQRVAWHGYLVIAVGLMPAVRGWQCDRQAQAEFTVLIALLHEHGGLWGADGPRLLAIARRAQTMFGTGDLAGSALLLGALARRLFALSRPAPTAVSGRSEGDGAGA
ncbi:hypothetical protein [Catellatospora tritici]|uniref:hypothetical protein n=1 Tax=Catellatospora tritici TaxID=2851566 RepID=UPI001C2DD207|nr:hypothetical protein [Catellatospora tritici]MBV1856274.1 hypothetical protein [Catellatospora tritici]